MVDRREIVSARFAPAKLAREGTCADTYLRGTLRSWPVDRRVNSPRNSAAELLEPFGEAAGCTFLQSHAKTD
jgi:hypothetical protein